MFFISFICMSTQVSTVNVKDLKAFYLAHTPALARCFGSSDMHLQLLPGLYRLDKQRLQTSVCKGFFLSPSLGRGGGVELPKVRDQFCTWSDVMCQGSALKTNLVPQDRKHSSFALLPGLLGNELQAASQLEVHGDDGGWKGKSPVTLTACLPQCRRPVPPAPAADSSTPGQLHTHDRVGLL